MVGVSKYKNNSVASKKKHIYSRLLDYFSMFVLSYIIFTVVYMVGGRLPSFVKTTEQYNDISLNAARYIGETHLRSFDEEKKALSDQGEDTVKYLLTLTKTSAYVNEINYPIKQDDGTYIEKPVEKSETFIDHALEYNKDNLSYYFKTFKKNESSLNSYVYDGVDYKDDIDTYLYIKIMGIDSNDFIAKDNEKYIAKSEGVSNFVILNEENTNKMINRIAKGETIDPTAVSLYNKLYGAYGNTIQYGINEVESKSETYLALLNQFQQVYQSLALQLFLMYLISYLFAYVGTIVILRVISKEWVTLGQRVLNLGISSVNENEVSILQLLGYHLLNFVLGLTTSMIAFFLMGMFGVFSLQIFPHVTLLAVMLFLLTLNIISLFFPFFNKNGHDLTSFACRILLKDKNEFDAPVDVEELSDEEFDKEEVVDAEIEENKEDDGK